MRLVSTCLVALGCSVALTACAGHRVVIDVPNRTDRRPPRTAPRAPPVERIGHRSIDVKEIHANVVSARVIYAKEVHAREGRVGRVELAKDREFDHADGGLKRGDVVADVIYAKEIHADYLEADVIYAKEVKIGR
jgi:hypothetical protein